MSNVYQEGSEKGSKDNVILSALANLLLLFPIDTKHITFILHIYHPVMGTMTK